MAPMGHVHPVNGAKARSDEDELAVVHSFHKAPLLYGLCASGEVPPHLKRATNASAASERDFNCSASCSASCFTSFFTSFFGYYTTDLVYIKKA